MAKSEVLRIRVSERLQRRVDQEAANRGMNRSSFIRHCIEKELPNPKEVIIMTREKLIEKLKGKRILVDAEWLEENDSELLEWITSSEYWGRGYDYTPGRSEAVIKIECDEGGTRYYATFESHPNGVQQSLNNQPAWGEDKWEDWDDIEQLKKYYKEVK
ncbi:MAG: type II toxin-antitoxin system HicB family antitoxin [Halanaerobiales bacterium]|nr:type II toxin-antitoxin system HicB family antitoxin [Halanaerobiales bacterium]